MTLDLTSLFVAICLIGNVIATSVPYERLNKNDTVLLIVDLQVGLYEAVRDFDPTVYRNNMMAHAAIGKLFNLPVVMTTSAQTGPNGPLPKEILEMYPDAPLIKRLGEVNAWDNSDFRAAVKATGKNQIVMAGIVTDVCTTFLGLSLRSEGYSVWANAEASGTVNDKVASDANTRMAAAGIQIVSLFSIICELMRDWRSDPGALTVLPWLDQYFPNYGFIARGHGAAVENGSLIKGEKGLLIEGKTALLSQSN